MANHYKNYLLLVILVAIVQPLYTFSQGGIKIESGAYLVSNSTANIVVNNAGITNDGVFTAASGTVIFTGNTATANSFIAGSASTNFYDLVLNKSSNGLLLNRSIGVSNGLTFTSGDSIYLNNFNIDLGTTGSVSSEANASRITGLNGGYIQSTQTLNAPSAVNPGNLGIEITSLANLGSTVIRRGHMVYGASISRNFQIIPTNNSGLNATITFHYLDNESGALNESLLQMYTSPDAGVSWGTVASDPANTVANTVTASGLDQLNMYTLAETGAVLPVHLLSFNAALVNKQSLLNWSSDNELNLDRYEIERSTDGVHFTLLASVAGKGGSNTQYYTYTDVNAVNGINYYRLKVVDANGKFVYSNVVLVRVNAAGDLYLNVYPNPAQHEVKLVFAAEKNEPYKIEVFNASGYRVDAKYVSAVNGINNVLLNIQTLPAGVYSVRLTGSSSKSIQFIKN
jgi:hypothetical protein